MNERNMTANISGKQINIAKDNATIRAIQNNRIEEKELDLCQLSENHFMIFCLIYGLIIKS